VTALSTLLALKSAKTRADLATLLRYRGTTLTYILYKIPPAARYSTFWIPKKGGGGRRIDAPNPLLKSLQRSLADRLDECLTEIETASKHKNRLSHAFRHDASIISNAKAHKARRYVLNLDLKDFFPSFNFGRVRGFFLANNHFKLAESVATTIAQIACNDGRLPQGSPCSPVLTELLTHFLDIRLARFARHYKCTYSRYADDLTFSTNQKAFPAALAVQEGEAWKLGDELRTRVEGSGFTINNVKTRMQCRGSRQSVTGLVVNEKVNVAESYYKLVRAMAHRFLATGTYQHDGADQTSIDLLEGMLNHVYHIRERQVDLALQSISNSEKRARLQKDRREAKREYPSAIRTLYHRVVFYRHFIEVPALQRHGCAVTASCWPL
jgi:RNA-directed DNA polymerase